MRSRELVAIFFIISGIIKFKETLPPYFFIGIAITVGLFQIAEKISVTKERKQS